MRSEKAEVNSEERARGEGAQQSWKVSWLGEERQVALNPGL